MLGQFFLGRDHMDHRLLFDGIKEHLLENDRDRSGLVLETEFVGVEFFQLISLQRRILLDGHRDGSRLGQIKLIKFFLSFFLPLALELGVVARFGAVEGGLKPAALDLSPGPTPGKAKKSVTILTCPFCFKRLLTSFRKALEKRRYLTCLFLGQGQGKRQWI